ncbi:hypothetical protein Rpal_3378 [Rhodopseudomonas palustris TIE-1]|uniref:hypothetical protein n=1 Tax=Rhodopseudomonas palustris TaxID=1076 RepID=UPI000164A956|nr:hypothetical protein [Rhodopseudomonas palustris]ACF01880.1 hypothetical protein Rpal_3378 [Rhodopseudomonas palustris TIE-1]
MAGADEQMKKLLKELKPLTAYERHLRIVALAEQYGSGFAWAVKKEFEKLNQRKSDGASR